MMDVDHEDALAFDVAFLHEDHSVRLSALNLPILLVDFLKKPFKVFLTGDFRYDRADILFKGLVPFGLRQGCIVLSTEQGDQLVLSTRQQCSKLVPQPLLELLAVNALKACDRDGIAVRARLIYRKPLVHYSCRLIIENDLQNFIQRTLQDPVADHAQDERSEAVCIAPTELFGVFAR